MKDRYCKRCRENAKIYYKGLWYVACACSMTKDYGSRFEAIEAWERGETKPTPDYPEGRAV